MDHFNYQHDCLHAEQVDLNALATEFGTPCYVYSKATIERHYKAFSSAASAHPHSLVCYAVKANSNLAVLNVLSKLGSGFDIVSGGELRRVIAAGGDPAKVVFSGVAKNADDMRFALQLGIKCFNVVSKDLKLLYVEFPSVKSVRKWFYKVFVGRCSLSADVSEKSKQSFSNVIYFLKLFNRERTGSANFSKEHPNEHPNESLIALSESQDTNPIEYCVLCLFGLVFVPPIGLDLLTKDSSSEYSNSLQCSQHKAPFHRCHRELFVPTNGCFNRSLLKLCGDVEENPGPDDADANGPRQGRGHDNDMDRERDQERGQYRELGEGTGFDSRENVGKCDLRVLTYNVRGLSCPKKVCHIVNACYKSTNGPANSFFMLQETFVVRLDILNYLWRGEFHLTPGSGNARGCLTLITSPFKIIHASDFEDRAHVLVLTKNNLDSAEIILVNVYAPNGYDEGKIRFFEELFEKVSDTMATYNCSNVIIGGDFNVVLHANEIKNRQYSSAENRVANVLKMFLQQLNLEDGWETSSNKQYTWNSNRSGQLTCSTLDRILYTKDLFRLSTMTTDWALSLSDHAAVKASLNYKNNNTDTKGSRISRLDPRLLLDPEGRRHLEDRFRELIDQAMPDWNPHVRLEFFKMCIRTAANDANGKVKASIRDSEACLNSDINDVVEELTVNGLQRDRKELLMNKLDDLRQLKRNLVHKVGTRLEQKAARKWYNEGELSNKYFFNLLNRKNNDTVSSILDDQGVETNDPALVESKIRNFYKDLYENMSDLNENNQFFRNVPQVSQVEAASLTEELTLDELTVTLKTCADSAPGPDGIPYSFLKHFWTDFGPVLLASWKHSIIIKDLPPSHKISYLRLIPKAGKDSRIISNLRPITLSNTDHKLITKTYARKLTNIVESCIGGEQTAYIPGRLINDNVRAMLMTINLANRDREVDGVVVSLDAKKAFDSVDHNYIRKCLEAFGLKNFVNIFDVLYKNLKSNIILNGRIIDGYSILKGVKQGDALSCILFVMCMEPLIRNVKANAMIRPITSPNQLNFEIPKVYSFADDVTVVAKNEDQGVQEIFNEYEEFTKVSGLELNASKTEILCFNERPEIVKNFNVRYNGNIHQLLSMENIKVNGIVLFQSPERCEEVNVAKAIGAMERLLTSWSTRRLTLIGRILVIKTFAISKMIYLMQTLTLSEKSYKEFIKIVFKFLWNRNFNAARAPERLKRSIMCTPVDLGGFGMVDVRALGNSLDLRAYGRLLVTNHPFMLNVRNCLIAKNFFEMRFNANTDYKANRGLSLVNEARSRLLMLPDAANLLRDLNLRRVLSAHSLSELITAAGRQSLAFFAIHTRRPGIELGQLTVQEFDSIARFLIYPELRDLIRNLIMLPLNVLPTNGSLTITDIFPINGRITNVSAISSKQFRLDLIDRELEIICVYKLGPILTPGEVLSWTRTTRKLTSTRHKNILLRLVHGDIFSNGRLARFGLRPNPGCANCQEPNETIQHKIRECGNATAAWEELERVKRDLSLTNLSDLSLENLIGAKDRIGKIELALQAELIHRLTSRNEAYHPKELVKTVVKFVSYSERLDIELKAKFDEVLRRWNG